MKELDKIVQIIDSEGDIYGLTESGYLYMLCNNGWEPMIPSPRL